MCGATLSGGMATRLICLSGGLQGLTQLLVAPEHASPAEQVLHEEERLPGLTVRLVGCLDPVVEPGRPRGRGEHTPSDGALLAGEAEIPALDVDAPAVLDAASGRRSIPDVLRHRYFRSL